MLLVLLVHFFMFGVERLLYLFFRKHLVVKVADGDGSIVQDAKRWFLASFWEGDGACVADERAMSAFISDP